MNAQIATMEYAAKRWKLLLCAFLFVASQVFFQVHAIEHVSDDETETCEVCFSGSGLKHGLVDSAPVGQLPSLDLTPVTCSFSALTYLPFVPFHQRAPPLNTPAV